MPCDNMTLALHVWESGYRGRTPSDFTSQGQVTWPCRASLGLGNNKTMSTREEDNLLGHLSNLMSEYGHVLRETGIAPASAAA